MLPWNTGAHKFRHLPCHQPSTPFTFPPPVLPSSGDGVALLSFIKVPPSLYALLSSELFEGVSHSPFPLRGWRDGAAAGGECWPQHRRNSVFIGWWEWFISSVWWWFSALFFFNVISQFFKCWPLRKQCWERKFTMDLVCSFIFLLGIPRIESPNHSCLGDFSGLSLYWAILRDAGTPTPKSRIASAHYQSSKSSMLRVPFLHHNPLHVRASRQVYLLRPQRI